MKSNTILYIVIALLGLGVVYLMFFSKEKPKETAAQDPIAPKVPTIGGPCFDVPSSFSSFNSALVPSIAQEFLGFTGVQFDYNMQQRIVGFFTAIDVEPTDERMKYFGKQAILTYLDSPSGQLPHWDVVKGSLRCSTQKNFVRIV